MLKNKYKIIKNFLEISFFKQIQNFLFSEECPWYYKKNMTTDDSYFFNFCFYNYSTPQTPMFDSMMRPVVNLLECNMLSEIRANLVLKKEKKYCSNFHVDRSFPCKTAILYMNTCNGYTLLDEKEKIKILCEENKLLIFDTNIKHAMVSQTDTERRIVINFNYI